MTLRVLESGLCTLVVDLGRPNCRSLGMPVGGAADRFALAVGNALVGNPADAAALEITLAGPTLRASCELGCVLYGAPFLLSSDRQELKPGVTFTLSAGEEVRIGGTPRGVRAYFCVRGGLQQKVILGSRSGLLPLAAGAELTCLAGTIGSRFVQPPSTWDGELFVLRALPGSQADWFESQPLYEGRFIVEPASNRMGLRLSGDRLSRRDQTATEPAVELVSEPTCWGTVQVTNDGKCIVLGVDGQSIGGYPKIAQVISADIDKLGQLRPGDEISFARVTLEQAETLYRAKQQELAEWTTRLRISLAT